MAEDESILVNPPTQDVAVHVRDYTHFTRLLKWGAIICLIISLLSLVLIKSYWQSQPHENHRSERSGGRDALRGDSRDRQEIRRARSRGGGRERRRRRRC